MTISRTATTQTTGARRLPRAAVIAALPLALAGTLFTPATASAHASATPRHACPSYCPTIYAPVICHFDSGPSRRFSSECFARIYACKEGLEILGCTRVS